MLLHSSLAVFVGVSLFASAASAQVGRRFPSERSIVNDAVTGVPLTVLTDGHVSDSKIYQTHPQWSADGKWIIFRSGGRAPGSQAYAVNESDGTIVQLTEGAGNDTGTLNLTRKSMKLYFIRDADTHAVPIVGMPATDPATTQPTTQASTEGHTFQMIELDLGRLLDDAVAGKTSNATYERVVGTLPKGMRESGGFGIDADEKTAYVGVRGGDCGTHLPAGVAVMPTPPGARMGAGPAGIRAMDLATGAVRVVIDTPFLMGHVQANPFVPGEIVYAYETGGDASQRMWTTHADGSGNRPLFVEEPLDWVTHETVVTPDEVMFNLIGHQPRLRVRPTGICVINLRTNAVELLGQVNEHGQGTVDDTHQTQNAAGPDSYGGFWHCNGSHDGKWAVGDTFLGNVWLINRSNGLRSLLASDVKMKPDHSHPTFSDDSTRILIQSGHWTDGQRLQLVVIPVSIAK